jgi:hypothetical protein
MVELATSINGARGRGEGSGGLTQQKDAAKVAAENMKDVERVRANK